MTNKELLHASFLDILFDGRNKDYGAYALRRSYSARMMISLLAALVLALALVACYYFFGNTGIPAQTGRHGGVIVERWIDMPAPVPMPPPVRPAMKRPAIATLANVTPRIVRDELADNNKLHDLDELKSAQTSMIDAPGLVADGTIPAQVTEVSGSETAAIAPEKPVVMLPSRNPEFPGGADALSKWLSRNLNVPSELESGERKMVKARFRVDKDGGVSVVEIEMSGGASFDREVIRVCKKMPRWKPAIQNGEAVTMSYVLPVTFIGVEQ